MIGNSLADVTVDEALVELVSVSSAPPTLSTSARKAAPPALIALLPLSRCFTLSQAGLPLAWMLYLGLPITAAGVLFALRLINLGAGWPTKDVKHDVGTSARAMPLPPPRALDSESLKELEALQAEGAISDVEYNARRRHSGM